jgi:hypothetical protein
MPVLITPEKSAYRKLAFGDSQLVISPFLRHWAAFNPVDGRTDSMRPEIKVQNIRPEPDENVHSHANK